MAEEVEISGRALVIRFPPSDPEAVLRRAGKEHRRDGHYGVSVFADVKRGQEDDDALVARLLEVSGLAGMEPGRNPKYYRCQTAQELLDRGFAFMKDREDGELTEHYCVSLGVAPSVQDAGRFLEPFGPVEAR